MVTTRENYVVIIQKNMIKKSKHTDTQLHRNTQKKQDKKQGKMDLQNNKQIV